jgi:mono/diheme cytochrome c family protein
MKAPFVLALMLGTVLAGPGEAHAAGALEQRGHALAARLCAPCHAIGKADAGARTGAPPLRALDRRTDLDEFVDRLREGLSSGHRDMPEFRFTRADARALVGYMRTIQSP